MTPAKPHLLRLRKTLAHFRLGLSGCLLAAILGFAQNADQKKAPPAPQASQPESSLPPLQLDGNAALHHLNQVISWYRHCTSGIHDVGLPSDAIYEDNAKNLASQIVQLAFQSAKVESALLQSQQKNVPNQSAATTQRQRLDQLKTDASSKIDQLKSQIDDLNKQLPKARAAKRESLISRRDALESEIGLQQARLDVAQKMSVFIESSGEAGHGMEADINRLAQSIPEVLGHANSQTPTATKPASKPTLASSGGLIGEAMTLYDYMSSVHQIDGLVKQTDYTVNVVNQLRGPLRDALRGALSRSEQLASQAAATDPEQLRIQQKMFQELTERFKQLAGALVPLSQEVIVLNDSKSNLEEWRDSIARESKYILRSVLIRVGVILIALAALFCLSEIWRRVTFRYVSDPRRRRQFLVLRRVMIGFSLAVILTLGFVSQFSSLATFAGFITAGIAVGLQAVLLSVAAYFFIIGRYGIRVGDRISVAGITGDVVDIGLVRLYIMELAGTGLDFYPTGRIVVFSNSVLFQTGTPLFKQIPGTEYAWHEVVVMIAPNGNHKAAQEKLERVVSDVYSHYRDEIERQHATIERRVDIQIEMPRPEARLQFADAGLELLVRYPVEIRRAPDIDEEMTRKVLDMVETDTALKSALSGTPKIRSVVKG
jgi:small-conductance mechanosensitive channel